MPSKQQSILIGGVVVGILSTSVIGLINLICCAGVIIGGMAGVWHYTSTHGLTIEASEGAVIGALSGVLGAIIAGILTYILMTLGLDIAQNIQQSILENYGGNLSAEELEAMQGGTGPLVYALGVLFNVVVYAIFGAIGGAIGASVFKKGSASESGPAI